MNGEPDRAALHFALAGDRNLERLLASRRVKERAEGGCFTGLLVSDLTAAGMATEALLDAARTGTGSRAAMPLRAPVNRATYLARTRTTTRRARREASQSRFPPVIAPPGFEPGTSRL
jgi:hypothetical protein